MTARTVSAVVPLVAVLSWIAPSAARAQVGLHVPAGATCAPAIERLTSDLTEFQKDAQDQGLDFITAGTVPIGGAGLHWGPSEWNNPTLANAAQLQAYRETMNQWVDGVQRYRVVLTQFENCTIANPPPPPVPGPDGTVPVGGIGLTWENCVTTYSTRLEPVVQQYARTLLRQPAQKAMQSVRKASSLVRNYATKLGTPTSGAFGNVSGCVNDYQVRAQQVADSVSPSNSPVSQLAPQPKAKAGSGGTAAKSGALFSPTETVLLGVVGAGAATAVALRAAEEAKNEAANCDSQETAMMNTVTAMQNAANNLAACGGNVTCYNSRFPALQSTWQTAASAAGNYCTCSGAHTQLSASEKEMVQWVWSAAAQMGWNPGTLPSCFK